METLAFITQSINSVIYQPCQSGWLIMGCHGGEWHIRKVWLTMPVAGAGLLPPSPVINVLSACNPTPTLNEARIYHLGRVADVRGKGIQVARNNILFLACAWHVWQALTTTKKVCVSTNFSGGSFGCGVHPLLHAHESRVRKKTPSPFALLYWGTEIIGVLD